MDTILQSAIQNVIDHNAKKEEDPAGNDPAAEDKQKEQDPPADGPARKRRAGKILTHGRETSISID